MTATIEGQRECRFGVTDAELVARLGDRYEEFQNWMYGQTLAICTGKQWNLEIKEYEPTNCGPHGMVVYEHDVKRFEDGRPIID